MTAAALFGHSADNSLGQTLDLTDPLIFGNNIGGDYVPR